jgi:hypothetical protein
MMAEGQYGDPRQIDDVRTRRAATTELGAGLKRNEETNAPEVAFARFTPLYADADGAVDIRVGDGLEVAQGSPLRVVVAPGPGMSFHAGKLVPSLSASVKLDDRDRLIARPTAAEVVYDAELATPSTVEDEIDRLQENQTITQGEVDALEVRVTAEEAATVTQLATNDTLTLSIADVSDELHDHIGDPTNVHGIVNTADLGLKSGNLSQFAATTSAQLAGVLSDETGSGAAVFATSPTLVTPALGTPSSGVLTNCTGVHKTSQTTFEIVFSGLTTSGFTWTNLPVLLGFMNASARHVLTYDLAYFTQVRLKLYKAATAGSAGSFVGAYFRSAFSATAADYAIIGTSAVELAVDVAEAPYATAWIDLAAGAKADVHVACMGYGGDGVTDPTFGKIALEFR